MRRWIGHYIGLMLIMVGVIMMMGVVQVYAAEGDTSGKCGDNVTWNYTALTKTLTLSGSGATNDYEMIDTPWMPTIYREIENIVIGNNITGIGKELFGGCTSLKKVVIPESVASIGSSAFVGCSSLENIQLPQKATVGAEVFQGCLALKQITGAGAIDGVLYANTIFGYSLQYYPPSKEGDTFEIPESVVVITPYSLENQKYLKKIVIPQSVSRIYFSSIWKPQNTLNVTFRGSISKFTYLNSESITALPAGSTITVGTKEDKDLLLDKLDKNEITSDMVIIANTPATGLTFKDGSTNETAIVKPGEIYTPTVKLAPYDTTDQVTWSYETPDSNAVVSFNSYTGAIELGQCGKVTLSGRTGSGCTVRSEVYFYLPCDRESLKVGFNETQGFLGDRTGQVLRVPLTGAISNQFQGYYANMWMNTEPVRNGAGWAYPYAVTRMSLESSNSSVIQLEQGTGRIIPKGLGTTVITAKADDGPNGYITRSFTVEVAERSVMDCQYYNAKGTAYVEHLGIPLENKSELVVKDGGSTLQQGIDYEVTYEGAQPDGNTTMYSLDIIIKGIGRYAGEKRLSCSIMGSSGNANGGAGGNPESGDKDDVPLKPSIVGVKDSYTQSYGGKAFTLKAKGNGKLSYTSSNKKVATVGKTNGKVTLKEIGSTTITIKSSDASKKVKVQVVPRKPSIKAGASGKKAIKVTWKKDSKSTGYQIQLTTDKKYKKGIKSITVKKNKTTSYTVKKLAGKKTYYVRLRSYKTVSGKKYYSDWSSVKKVRTK